jgi:succinate-semialdehyde dehydrogenase/glutarate-semialdehyde dehydrogenase
MTVGHGFDDGVLQGPLINQAGFDKSANHVQGALDLGAEAMVGGYPLMFANADGEAVGNFFAPTVLRGVTDAMPMTLDETFGPVAPLYRFSSDDEALAMANCSASGLASYCPGPPGAVKRP